MNKCFDKHSFAELNMIDSGMFKDALNMTNDIFHFDKESGVFVDVGSCAGSFVRVLGMLGYMKNIHCFEPHPTLATAIKEHYPHVKVNDYCLGNNDNTVTVNIPTWSVGVSSIINKKSFTELAETQQVHQVHTPCITLDTYCLINGIDCIDFLKIDVNGYEKHVLEGAVTMLSENRIKCGIFSITSFQDSGYTEDDIIQFLAQHNYKIYRLRTTDLVFISLVEWKNKRTISVDN